MTGCTGASPVVLAVDGGGSKTDVVAIGLDGRIVAHARGSGSNPQTAGWPRALEILVTLRDRVLAAMGDREIVTTHVYLAGLDLPAELDVARERLAHWGPRGRGPDVLDNDLFALLRAGTLSPDAVAVVCGTGINALGVRADGATARFPALGEISGDWGGGAHLGIRALWHAARADDGRGETTLLCELVPRALGLASVREVVEGLHFGRLPRRSINLLSPVVFDAARQGDRVAAAIVERQVDEVVVLATTCLRRLGLDDRPVPIVLGGGVIAGQSRTLVPGIADRLARTAPRAETVLVTSPPILGAGLAALDAAGAARSALGRYREGVAAVDFAPSVAPPG